MTATFCSYCSSLVEVESVHGSELCRECGQILSEGGIVSEAPPPWKQSDGAAAKRSSYPTKRPYYLRGPGKSGSDLPEGVRSCLDMARRLCHGLDHQALSSEVESAVKRVFMDDRFVNRRMDAKKTITACVVHQVLHSRGHRATFNDLARLCPDAPANFEHWRAQLLERFPDFGTVEARTSLDDLVYRMTAKLHFGQSLISTTERILHLARKVWLTEGFKLEPIVAASCYIAWASESPKDRTKVRIVKFCSTNGIQGAPAVARRLTLLFKVLKELALQMPWCRPEHCSPIINIIFHIKDILDYERVLISRAAGKIRESETGVSGPMVDEDESNYELRRKFKPGRKASPEWHPRADLPEGLDPMREELDEYDLDDDSLDEYLRKPEEVAALSEVAYTMEEAEESDDEMRKKMKLDD